MPTPPPSTTPATPDPAPTGEAPPTLPAPFTAPRPPTLPSPLSPEPAPSPAPAPAPSTHPTPTPSPARIGVVTISDRASRGQYEDLGGPAIRACLEEFLASPYRTISRVIPDERPLIEDTLRNLVDEEGCCLVVTTGGTGPARRDVTVEATLAVGHKHMPGFGELMRAVSFEKVPTAILSRQEAVVRYAGAGGALIVNLPGSPRSIRECLIAVFPAIPYCIDLIGGPRLETNDAVVRAFRPMK